MKRLDKLREESASTQSPRREIERNQVVRTLAGNTSPESLLRQGGSPTCLRSAEASCSIHFAGRAQPGKLQSNRAVILSGLNFILSMHKLPKSGAAKLTPCVASMKQRTR